MQTTLELYQAVRLQFPDITVTADREYIRLWDEMEPISPYSWFHSLANALNAQMCRGVEPANYSLLFELISNALECCTKEVHACIDVSFTENLFWQVSREKAELYWRVLPAPLKQLYLNFYRYPPSE